MSQNPFARFARWLGLDRNPLRRRCDRVEAMIRVVAVLGVVVAVLLGIMIGIREYEVGVAKEIRQARERHPVLATLTENVSVPRLSPAGTAVGQAKARWRAPDGTYREGAIDVTPGKRAGATIRIWTDARGAIVPRPRDRETTIVAAVTVGTGVPLAAAAGFGLLVALTRAVMVHRTRRLWEAQWTIVEPTWRINGR